MSLRTRNSAVLLKIEAEEGVYEAPDPATDAILVENPRINPKPNIIKTKEVTGSLDGFGSLVGGMSVELAFDVYLKGAGSPGTVPEWGEVLKCCGFAEIVTPAAIPVVAEAAAAGTATSLTLGNGAAATAQLYRGMPLELGGNPAEGAVSFVTDYGAGKVATLTERFAAPLSASTTYRVMPNVLYLPASNDIPTASIAWFVDGVCYRFCGARGTAQLSLDSGGVGKMSVTMWCMFEGKVDAPVPACAYDPTRPPIWKGGVMSIDRQRAAVKTLSINFGGGLVHPDDPNEEEGFEPAIIIERNITGNMDPSEVLVATQDRMTAFRTGTVQPVHARLGFAAGNRIGITIPQALHTNHQPGDRGGVATVGIPFDCVGQDSGVGLCIF